MSQTCFRVGTYMLPKKYEKMRMDEVKEAALSQLIELVYIDINKPIEEQGHFDLLVIKLTEDLIVEDVDSDAKKRINNVQNYLKLNPKIPVIDPPTSQRNTLNRAVISELLNDVDADLQKCNYPVRSPNFFVLSESKDDYLPDLTKHNISFPIVAKTITAAGSEESHVMGIIYNEKALHSTELKLPLLIQEFKNHNAVIFKVYQIGDALHSVRRPSLRNLNPNPESKSVIFHSQKGFPEEILEKNPPLTDLTKVPNPSDEVLKAIATALTKHVGMTLLGFDIIHCFETNSYGIIDINYFPTYGGVQSWPTDFVKLILSKLKPVLYFD